MSADPNITPWLTIVGLGEDGADGLSPASLKALQNAEIIMGAKRHLGLLPDLDAKFVEWPVPFADGLLSVCRGHKSRFDCVGERRDSCNPCLVSLVVLRTVVFRLT